MSAKGRGTTVADFEWYPTPSWVTHRFLDMAAPSLPWGPDALWCEPCVGDGSIVRAVDGWIGRVSPAGAPTWVTSDIDPRWPATWTGDFLSPEALALLGSVPIDVLITNPPFSLAWEIAKRGLEVSPRVILNLRINWLASATRQPWMVQNKPHMFVLPQRPSYKKNKHGKKGSDATDYCWLAWGPGFTPGKYDILGLTSKAERQGKKKVGV